MIQIKNGTLMTQETPACRGQATALLMPMLRRFSATLFAFWLAAAGGSALAQEAAQKLDTIRLNAGMHLINAEVAQTPAQRQIGLMHRPNMPTNDGMLFVFEERGMHCFWMKNTLLPLAIAFVADDGSIVNIAEMQAGSEASHCPRQPVRYALEMNQGWFAKRGFKAGARIDGGPFPVR
jgi:uncharacterized membrane protein (UPF0127 family)